MHRGAQNINYMKNEYIQLINEYLIKCNDISMLDFILKLLKKVTY